MTATQSVTDFDPTQPCQTRSGHETLIQVLPEKIIGFVIIDQTDTRVCEWSLSGKLATIYERKIGEWRDYDLVNVG